ncbi:ABC transporter CER5 [Capsaspora owczarzaki ATCC 30864]|uniref:ABC transporter CER5 n=1 Tax=Capsaspora owczarzaki (strain ATCC 30864) TaxID=595528 RepID=UPI0001FE5960|nr:ABC transporter CER5 [Capsaspora owczarzaki ATCC 30864]|eukprot:XP_004346076.1 ABC transporter CER5 [Capsaspora owczarzaki ATCC 30864]
MLNGANAAAPPCNTTLLDNLNLANLAARDCLATAANASATGSAALCAPLAPGPYCACSRCQTDFDQLFTAYQAVHTSTNAREYPVNAPLCAPQTGSALAAIPAAGQATLDLCLNAIEASCTTTPDLPYCQNCLNGVCYASSTNTSASPDGFISLFDVMCNPTGPFAAQMVDGLAGSLNQPYSVDLWSIEYNSVSHVYTTSDPVNLISSYPAWSKPPVVFSHTNCTPNPSVVQHVGSTAICKPGLSCQTYDGHISSIVFCPSGHFCPDPMQPPQECPAGYFCPEAIVSPIKCGPLDQCPKGAKNHIPVIGLLVLGILTPVFVALHFILRALERRRYRQYARDLHSTSKDRRGALVLAPLPSRMDITFSDIKVVIRKASAGSRLSKLMQQIRQTDQAVTAGKTIMNNVSGAFRANRVTAIMGGSGAGKSTLINAVMGKIKRAGGQVCINGVEAEPSRYRNITGYTPQEDVMLTMLTVGEILTHSARLRLPREWTNAQINQHIDAVISILGLAEVRNSRIGDEVKRGVSGGQRKRVNIAMELVANPSLLVLDEPTTGLDATSAWEVVKCLKAIANAGRTVVAVIHQPRFEVFALFDDLLMLSKGGFTAYNGPTSEIAGYFGSIGFPVPATGNPADFYLDVLAGKIPRQGDPAFHPTHMAELWKQNGGMLERLSANLADSAQHQLEIASTDAALDQVDTLVVEMHRNASAAGLSVVPSDATPSATTTSTTTTTSTPSSNALVPAPTQNHASQATSQKSMPEKRVSPSALTQFWVFFGRALLQRFRTPAGTILFVGIHILSAAALGAGFMQGTRLYLPPLPDFVSEFCPPAIQHYCRAFPIFNLGLFSSSFFLSVALGSSSIIIAVFNFGDERAVCWREASWGTNRAAYTVAKYLAELPWMFAASFAFASVLSPMLRPITSFGDLLVIIFMTQFAAFGLGYIISIIVSRESSMVVGTVAVFAFSVCSGLSPRLAQIRDSYSVARIIWDVSFPRYAAEALYISEAKAYTDEESIFRAPVLRSLDFLGYRVDNVPFDLGMLCVLGVGFRLIAYLLLVFWNRRKQQ